MEKENGARTSEKAFEGIECLLPDDWEEKASELKALQRKRHISNAEQLLTLCLLYGGSADSYQAASAVMTLDMGIALDKNATLKRIQGCADWLRYLAEGVCAKSKVVMPEPSFLQNRPLVLVDASELPVRGSRGGNYRLHYAFDLFGFTCRDMHVTQVVQGEKLSMHDIHPGDIVEADRIYGSINGMEYVRSHQADFILRLRHNAFKLYDAEGQTIDVLSRAKGLKAHQRCEINGFYRVGQERKPVRIVVIRNDEQAIAKAQRRMDRNACRKQIAPASDRAREANEYEILATSLDIPAAQIAEVYRARWQIETVFLRMKALFGLGSIPCKNPRGVESWFFARLLLAALCEAKIRRLSFSPSGAGNSQSEYMERDEADTASLESEGM